MTGAVVTYIFGEGQELLREPLVVEPGVKYVCVTDNTGLTSSVVDVVHDEVGHLTCLRDKVAYVKLHPWLYADADWYLVIDGALQLAAPIARLFSHCDRFLFKRHPARHSIAEELPVWVAARGMPATVAEHVHTAAVAQGIDLTVGPLVELCAFAFPNAPWSRALLEEAYGLLERFGEDGSLFLSNQIALTYALLHNPDTPYAWLQPSDFARHYQHGTWTPRDPALSRPSRRQKALALARRLRISSKR